MYTNYSFQVHLCINMHIHASISILKKFKEDFFFVSGSVFNKIKLVLYIDRKLNNSKERKYWKY